MVSAVSAFTCAVLTMMKLFNQFEHVDNATPFARSEEGKISAGNAHGTGLPKINQWPIS